MKQKQTLTVLILMMCLGITSCGQPAQTTQSQAPASTATQTPASPSATRIPAEPTPDPSSMDTIDLYEYDSIDPAKGDTLAGDDFLKKCSDGDCLVVNENVKKILPATPKQSPEESDSNMVDLLLLRTSDLDVESIVNLLEFVSPDDIVWFDHGKRRYYSVLDDKLGDFFKEYLPDFKPKNGFLIYKGTLLYYYGKSKDIIIPNSVKTIAENAFSRNDNGSKLNRIVIPDSVKEIKSFAFSGRRVKTMIFGKGIRKIEECSLCDTIDTLVFQGKTDKILKNGFDELFSEDFEEDTTLEFPNDFSESFTPCYADVTPSGSKKNPEYRFDVEWAQVKGADGYEIKTEGITKTVESGKSHGKLHIPSKNAADEDADYYGSISIRPFRYVNGRKQYGRTYRTYCEYETGC